MKNSMILKRLFLWYPSQDTGIAFLSEFVIAFLVYPALTIFEQGWASTVIYGGIGQLEVFIILPLYWMVVVRKEKLDVFWITKNTGSLAW